MPKTKMIKIKKGDIEAECLRSAVPAWERNGWTVVDDGTSDQEPAPTGDPSQGEQVGPTADTDTGQNQNEE